jgi:hypothetical protein
MNVGKFTAIVTGAISIFLAIAYLVLVQILDFRGEMLPAPISMIDFTQFAWGDQSLFWPPSVLNYLGICLGNF